MGLKELLCSLEERLVEHDNNRKEVQNELQEVCTKILNDADSLEEKITEKLHESFDTIEERILSLIENLNSIVQKGDLGVLIIQAQKELSHEVKYEIRRIIEADKFVDSYELEIIESNNYNIKKENDNEVIINELQKHLNKIHESVNTVQEKLIEIVAKRKAGAIRLEKRINEQLKSLFIQEDTRIQDVVNEVKKKIDDKSSEEKIKSKAKLTLLLNQKYSLFVPPEDYSIYLYKIVVTKEISLKNINFEKRKPSNIFPTFTDKGELSFSFLYFSNDEIEILNTVNPQFKVTMKILDKNNQNEENSKIISKEYSLGKSLTCFVDSLNPNATYILKMRIEHQRLSSQWSDEIEFITPEFKACVWKKCPDVIDNMRVYFVDENNHRVATKVDYGNNYSTIIGNAPLPLNKVTSWNIKILKSSNNNGSGIYIGVAPFDINQNETFIFNRRGWYFDCYSSTLCSGLPHNHDDKKYGPRKEFGKYIHTGDSVGVVMDTAKGGLSFVVNRVNLGVAYEGIPLNKPLVPCVILRNGGDSVEFVPSEVKENMDKSIPVISNITITNITWDSITFTWYTIEGADFYQIEVDGNKLCGSSTTNTFTKIGLFPEAEYSFRVRTVKGAKVSEWSDIVEGRTQKAPEFNECVWKECPDYVDRRREYSVFRNSQKIATKFGFDFSDNYSTVIGNSPLPLSKVTSWNIKILKPEYDYENDIYIGVAPFDIDQDNKNNKNECGWYFDCYDSTLNSGPPHNLKREIYGPRKKDGEYVKMGGIVGVVMDTTKGDLTFVLNGVNLGAAYEGIPLDKPLVPCVILGKDYDSVGINLPENEEIEIDYSILVPSNIRTTGNSDNSITLTWDTVEGASFYHVEICKDNLICITTVNKFTKRRLCDNNYYDFRVRTVKESKVSGWSNVIRGKTEKRRGSEWPELFANCDL